MSPKAKALVILIPGFPENEGDSTWVPAQQIFVKVLGEQKKDLKVLVLSFRFPEYPSRYSFFKAEVRTFGTLHKDWISRIRIWLAVYKNLIQIQREYRVIGILSFWLGECALVGHWFSKLNQIKHYCWLMGQDAKKNNPWKTFIQPKGEELIALSDFLKNEFYRNHKVYPFKVIPLGIDPKQFKKIPDQKTIDILGVGSLIPLKQFGLFVKIVQQLILFFPNLKAVVCGDGPEMESLHQKIKELSLTDHIRLLGSVPYSEVLDWMSQSKILLHTSRYEGFGMVILEALYSGNQVVSLNKPMNREIKNWKTVLSPAQLFQEVKKLLEAEYLGIERICPYTMENSVVQIMKVFHYAEEANS